MKKFRKILTCFVMCFCLMFAFAACGGGDEPEDSGGKTPEGSKPSGGTEVTEVWETSEISYDEYMELISGANFNLDKYKANIKTIYADNSNDEMVQIVNVIDNSGIGGIVSKLSVINGSSKLAYISDGKIYLDSNGEKLYSDISTITDMKVKTYPIFMLMKKAISLDKSNTLFLFDGSVFENPCTTFGQKNESAAEGDNGEIVTTLIDDTSKFECTLMKTTGKKKIIFKFNESEETSLTVSVNVSNGKVTGFTVVEKNEDYTRTYEINECNDVVDLSKVDFTLFGSEKKQDDNDDGDVSK